MEIEYKCKVECVKLRDTREHKMVDCDIMRCEYKKVNVFELILYFNN